MDSQEPAATSQLYADLFPQLPSTNTALQQQQQSAWSNNALRVSKVTEVLHIPFEEQKFKQGNAENNFGNQKESKIARIFGNISNETNTTIDHSSSKDGTLTLIVNGRRPDVARAKAMLLKDLQTQARIELNIPTEHHRFLIGKAGATMKELQERFSVNINIPKSEENSDIVRITGTTENVRKAAEEIRAISEERSKTAIVKVPVLKAYHPLIAGFNQSTIKRIQELTGAKIRIPPTSDDEDVIIVSGEKEGVDRAVAELNIIYNEKKLTCGELTAQVKKSQHRFVIGPKGCNLAEIMEKTGVVVEVPPPESDSETLILRGVQPNLVGALTLVYEKANSIVVEHVKVPSWMHRYIIGPKGANLKKITDNKPKVHVQFNDNDDVIEVEGPPTEVAEVNKALYALAKEIQATNAVAEVKFDMKYLNLVNGNVFGKVKADNQVRITTPADDTKPAVIRIEGTPENVPKAKAAVEAIVAKLATTRQIDLIIEQKLHSQIIGAGGKKVQEIIEKFHGLSIDFPKKNVESNIVTIRGDKKDVEEAEKFFKKLVKELELSSHVLEVRIFKQYHKNVIGKGGASINKIKDETNVRIDIPDDKDDSDIIKVTGTEANCKAAEKLLLAIQQEFANIVTEEIAIDQKLHKTLLGPKRPLIDSVMEECNVHVRFPRIGDKDKSDKVSIRGAPENVAKAKKTLQALASDTAESSHVVEVKVPAEYHRFIIGKAGANLNKIIAETGVLTVVFPNSKRRSVLVEGSAPTEADSVSIVGKPDACEAAKKLILARVTELENTVEEKVTVDPKYHKDLTANAFAFLKELGEELSVNVTIPAKDAKENRDVIVVKGSKGEVPQAIAKITAFVDDIARRVTEAFPMTRREIVGVLKTGGKRVQEICQELHVNIKFPERKRAPAGAAAAAAAAPAKKGKGKKEEKKAEEGAAEAAAPAEGAEATEAAAPAPAEAAAEAEAAAPAAEEEDDGKVKEETKITGTPEAIQKAIAALRELMPVAEVVEIDADLHQFVIGPKGAEVRAYSEAHDVNLKFPAPEKNDNKVTVFGSPKNIAAFKEALAAKMPEYLEQRKKHFKTEYVCDPAFHRALIGEKGAVVNQLRDKFNVNIDFPREKDAKKDVVVIIGLEADGKKCAAEMAKIVAEVQSYVTKTVQVHPDIHRRIIGAGGKNVRKLQDDLKVKINFPKKEGDDEISVFGPPEGVDAAIEEMTAIQDEFLQDILDREAEKAYLAPPSKQGNANSFFSAAPTSFTVRGAPWQMPTAGNDAAFPSLAGESKKPALSGAWGKRV